MPKKNKTTKRRYNKTKRRYNKTKRRYSKTKRIINSNKYFIKGGELSFLPYELLSDGKWIKRDSLGLRDQSGDLRKLWDQVYNVVIDSDKLTLGSDVYKEHREYKKKLQAFNSKKNSKEEKFEELEKKKLELKETEKELKETEEELEETKLSLRRAFDSVDNRFQITYEGGYRGLRWADPRRVPRKSDTTTYAYRFKIIDKQGRLHKEGMIHISGTKKDFESYEGFPSSDYDAFSKYKDKNLRRMSRLKYIGDWLAKRILIYINTYYIINGGDDIMDLRFGILDPNNIKTVLKPDKLPKSVEEESDLKKGRKSGITGI